MYSLAAEDNITPGVSLLPNTNGLSIEPDEIKTSFALMYHKRCFGKYFWVLGKWSPIRSDITSMLWS